MAEIDNEIVGPARTAAKVEILAKMPARLQFSQDLLVETEEALEPKPLFGRKTKNRN